MKIYRMKYFRHEIFAIYGNYRLGMELSIECVGMCYPKTGCLNYWCEFQLLATYSLYYCVFLAKFEPYLYGL